MNHLAVTSILTVVAHIIWFASMTERKYPIKKTVLLYGLYAIFFTVWAILAYSLLGKDSPYVIPFSFVGTILPAILLFLYTSSDSFSKKIFLIVTYANLFCIIICLSILICDGLFPDLSIVKQMYIRSLVRILLNVPAVLLYLWFARPYMRTVPGDRKRTWYSISLVSFLFLTVFATLINFLMRDGHTVEQMILFITTMMIYCAVLWIVFGTIQHMNAEVKMELITQNVQYLQGQLAMAKEHASTAKAMRHDFRHHMQNIDLLLKQQKPQEAIHYIEEFIQSLDAASQIDFCPHITANAILNNFYNQAQKEGITISITADTPEHITIADMDFVAILSNLLENAVLHGKTYTKIWIIVTHTPGRVEIAVEDDGQGIKESVLPVMFEGKISSDEEESDSKRNMGIGLSVCHSIVKAHKGGMHAENRAEGGARISFWLPMNEEDTDGY